MPKLFPSYSQLATPQVKSGKQVIYGNSPVFDFNTGEFLLNPSGTIVMATDLAALEQWIRKTLVTPRLTHSIYPQWYGSEAQNSLGNNDPTIRGVQSDIARIGDIETAIRNALSVDKRIQSVDAFSSIVTEDYVTTSFTVLTSRAQQLPITVVTETP
jgi:hypothetical protein